MGYLDVLLGTVATELGLVLRLDNHRHTLLRLADSKLGRVQTAILGRHTVEEDIQTICQLTNRNAHTTCTKVVRLLNQAGNLCSAEQTLQLTLLGSITLLHLTAALLERLGVVLLRRACCTTDTVATCTATEHQHNIARCGGLTANTVRLNCTHNCTYLHTLSGIAGVENLSHAGSRQTHLVTIRRVACRRFERDNPLGQLTLQGLSNGGIYVTCTRHTHRLVDITTSRQRVTDCTTQTGRSTTKGLNLGGVVVCLVLELQEVTLNLAINIYIDEDTASIVLLALLLVVERTNRREVARADSCQIHQAESFLSAAELCAQLLPQCHSLSERVTHCRGLNLDIGDVGGEGGVAAVVAPIGVEDAQLCLVGLATLIAEVLHNGTQIVGVHCQAPLRAESGKLLIALHLGKALQHRNGLLLCALAIVKAREVFLTRLHSVDVVVADALHILSRHARVEHQQTATLDSNLSRRLNQVNTVDCRSSTLVKLTGEILHSQHCTLCLGHLISHAVGHHLAEYTVAATLQQLVGEAEEVIDAEQTQRLDVERQISIELRTQTLSLHAEHLSFLYKYPSGFMILAHFILLYHGYCFNIGCLLCAEGIKLLSQLGVFEGQHLHCQQSSIFCTIDSHTSHGNTRRHLHHREERIQTLQATRLHRNTNHGQRSHRCHNTCKMCCATCACNNHLQATLACCSCPLGSQIGCTVRTDNSHLNLNAKTFKSIGGGHHNIQVTLGAHHNTYFHNSLYFA